MKIIFFDLVDNFVSYINNSCYAGITGYEFHYGYTKQVVPIQNMLISSGATVAGNIQ